MIDLRSPKAELTQIGLKYREIRLSLNMKRATLALKSGVSASTVQRFEASGEIAFHSFLRISKVLGITSWIHSILAEQHIASIDSLLKNEKTPKKRGRE